MKHLRLEEQSRGAAQILSHRLRDEGIRVISLYPPDFENIDPFNRRWLNHERNSNNQHTVQSVIDCLFIAICQPRDYFIRAIEFELLQVRSPD